MVWDGHQKPEEPISFKEVTRARPIPGKLLLQYLSDLDRETNLPTGPKFIELLADIDVGPADVEQILRLSAEKIKDGAENRNPSWQAFWAKLAYATLSEGLLGTAAKGVSTAILTQLAPIFQRLSEGLARAISSGPTPGNQDLVAAQACLAGTEVTLRVRGTIKLEDAPQEEESLTVPAREHGQVSFSEELLGLVNPQMLQRVIGDKQAALPAETNIDFKLCHAGSQTSLCVTVRRSERSEPEQHQRALEDPKKASVIYRAIDAVLNAELEGGLTPARHLSDRPLGPA